MPRLLHRLPIAAFLLVTFAGPARAQFGAPPNQPDMAVDATVRREVVDTLAAALEARYVFPDVGRKVGRSIAARARRGGFDGVTSAKALADTLGDLLRAESHDLHFQVFYSHQPYPAGPRENPDSTGPPAPEALEQARLLNHGFERVERLAGNIGYLELRMFDGSPRAGALAAAAMTFLAGTDALIIDLRRNGGGDPSLIVLLLSHLYPEGQRVHINDFHVREGNETQQFWSLPTVPGPRYVGKPIYVLTSANTFSAGEEFSYDVQALKLGTLVGETTGGGANPVTLVRLHDHFAAFIPYGRAINPITKTNWEGTGVTPDVKVKAEEALQTAHVAALTRLLEGASDPNRKATLERALQRVRSTGPAPTP